MSVHTASNRFDLTTVFVATAIWSALLAVMRLLHIPPRGVIIVSVLLIVIAAAQLLFRRCGHPRMVSMAAGVFWAVCGEVLLRLFQGPPGLPPLIYLVLLGAVYGYFAGVCTSAAFLLSDRIQVALRPLYCC